MYRDLANKHHPDHGGSVADMQEINAEWDELKPTLPRFCSQQARQGRQQYEQQQAASSAAKAAQDAETAKMADELSKHPGLAFDVVGSWIWADTNYKYIHTLEALGFRWSSNRCKYYWHPQGDTTRQAAILYHDTEDANHDGDAVIFGDAPDDIESADDLANLDWYAFSTDAADLATIEF